jgi:hypothetical protein
MGKYGHLTAEAVRTAGSWMTASAILYFTWLLVPH